MLKLQWLQINKFRAVKPGTRLLFNPSFNVLLGQNGTGKTTLLNLIAAVAGLDFTDFRDEEFDLEYELSHEAAGIVANVRNEWVVQAMSPALKALPRDMRNAVSEGLNAPVLSVEIRVVLHDETTPVVIRFDGSRGMAEVEYGVSSDKLELPIARTDARVWEVFMLASFELGRTPELKSRLPDWTKVLGGIASTVGLSRFDESLGYFESLREIQFAFKRHAENESVEHVHLPQAPIEFANKFRELAAQRWDAERYVLGSAQLDVLEIVTNLLGFKSAEVIVDVQESERHKGLQTLTLGNLRFLFVRSNGGRLSEQHLSYGQKRMLAFIFYLAVGRSIVVADELVNGLHHSWIQACIEELEGRQVFLTSQNPLLMDYLTFETPEQVRSTFVLCHWEPGDGEGQMIWADMSKEAAEDFFASYKVGFQQVGELLQSKGLW